tara:strand:- start:7317 stop:8414 length:1098 start_codon:yes stop_codon:yes gene_type:complete
MKVNLVNLEKTHKKIKKNLNKNLNQLFLKQKFILGDEVEKLEKNLSKITKAKYSLGVGSGSDALIVALLSCDLKKNDEVIIPDLTWISTIGSVIFAGGKPVVADVNSEDGTINLKSLSKKINKNTKVIITVGLYGHLPALDLIKKICTKNNIILINDGAQSFGSKYKNKYCHQYTSISCTSFFPAKVLGSYGDAGACFTNDKKLYDKMKMIRTHGQNKKSHSIILGLNARIDTIQACVLNEKLKYINKEIKLRKRKLKTYVKMLSKLNNIKILKPLKKCEPNGSSIVIRIKEKKNFQNYLAKKGIQTQNIYNYTLTEQPSFKKYKDNNVVNSKSIAKENVCLPINPYLTLSQIKYVIATIGKYLN